MSEMKNSVAIKGPFVCRALRCRTLPCIAMRRQPPPYATYARFFCRAALLSLCAIAHDCVVAWRFLCVAARGGRASARWRVRCGKLVLCFVLIVQRFCAVLSAFCQKTDDAKQKRERIRNRVWRGSLRTSEGGREDAWESSGKAAGTREGFKRGSKNEDVDAGTKRPDCAWAAFLQPELLQPKFSWPKCVQRLFAIAIFERFCAMGSVQQRPALRCSGACRFLRRASSFLHAESAPTVGGWFSPFDDCSEHAGFISYRCRLLCWSERAFVVACIGESAQSGIPWRVYYAERRLR